MKISLLLLCLFLPALGAAGYPVGSRMGSLGNTIGPSSATDGQIALFNGATGKVFKAASGTGVVHAASGVYSASAVLNADLATMATLTTKCNSTGGTAVPTDCSVATMKTVLGYLLTDIVSGGATGDVLYFNGSAWVRLAIGSSGQVLAVSGGIPAWTTSAASAINSVPGSVTSGHLVTWGANNATLADSGSAAASVVTGPGSSTSGAMCAYGNSSGNAIVNSVSNIDSNGNAEFGEAGLPTSPVSANGSDFCVSDACFYGKVGVGASTWQANSYNTGTGSASYKAKTTGSSSLIINDPVGGFGYYVAPSVSKDADTVPVPEFTVSPGGNAAVTGTLNVTGQVSFPNTGNATFGGLAVPVGIASSGLEACKERTLATATITAASSDCFILVNSTDTQDVTVNLFATSSCSFGQKIVIMDLKVNALVHNITVNAAGSDKFYGIFESTTNNATASVTMALSGDSLRLECSGYTSGRWVIW